MAATKADKDLIATAKERYKLAEEAERDIRKEAKIDLEFAAGNQWDAEDARLRNQVGNGRRPCLTFNKLLGPINQVANQARMNKPDLEALPVDSSGDADTANVIEGMIRHIEYTSKADQVYETALDQSAKGSFGYFKVSTRYCGNKTFDQELRIERITNPFAVLIDPYAKEADKSDMMWAFELEWMPRDDYQAEFGKSELAAMNFFDGGTNPAPDWIGKDGVLVARYWYIDVETKTLVAIQWPDGGVTNEYLDELQELPEGMKYATDADGNRIEREDEIRHVKMCRLNGVEILDETDWKG
ncbi:MAG: portal protein, partial [Bryobacteraceae bacterium]